MCEHFNVSWFHKIYTTHWNYQHCDRNWLWELRIFSLKRKVLTSRETNIAKWHPSQTQQFEVMLKIRDHSVFTLLRLATNLATVYFRCITQLKSGNQQLMRSCWDSENTSYSWLRHKSTRYCCCCINVARQRASSWLPHGHTVCLVSSLGQGWYRCWPDHVTEGGFGEF